VRFLDEHVFARAHGLHQVVRMELGGVSDEHHVRRLDDVLICFEAREEVVVAHGHLVGEFRLELVAPLAGPVHHDVRDGHQLDALIGRHGLAGRLGAPAAGADHAGADGVASGRVAGGGQRGRGAHQERAPGFGVLHISTE